MFMDSRPINLSNVTIPKLEDLTSNEWKRYFSIAQNLQVITNSTMIDLNLITLMGNNLNDFWRYDGSLTTPPCTEGIIWTMFRTPIVFSEYELDSFRKKLYFEDYRGPQPIYDRIIYRNFLRETLSSIPDYNCCWNNFSFGIRNQLWNKFYYLFSIFIQQIIYNEKNFSHI